MAAQTLENFRQQQASSLAYFDVFLLLAVVLLVPLLTVLLMRRSVAEKGASTSVRGVTRRVLMPLIP